MDVYLIPAGADRFELYCEVGAPVATDDAGPSFVGGYMDRFKRSFKRMLDEGEAEQARDPAEPPREGQGRLRRFITRKVAEVVVEQRLLWHLRKETHARLFHPDLAIDSERAVGLARTSLGADYARHRRWLCIDALLTAITGPVFFFVPGPNIISWYFTFRAVGHYLSMRGAKQGLTCVEWQGVPTPHLSAIAAALEGDPARRAEELDRAADGLGLQRLARFVERIRARQP
jgi:hypothetical protein